MPDKSSAFDFHGVRVLLRSRDEAPMADLRRDFAYFLASTSGEKADIELELRPCAPPADQKPKRALWRWRSARISQRDSLRTVDYQGRALLEYDMAREKGRLHCPDPALLHELAYLALLSRVGEQLDRRGFHRVHALGFSYRGQGGLLLLPSGGGKSWLGLELIRREGFELLSDDAPLLSGTQIVAFPVGIGLRGDDRRGVPDRFTRPFERRRFGLKHVVDLGYFLDRVRPAAPLSWILVGESGASSPSISVCSKARAAAAMIANLVLGIGTPQVLELISPSRLAGIGLRRARLAAQAVGAASCGRFTLCREPELNVQALEQFLAAKPCASPL